MNEGLLFPLFSSLVISYDLDYTFSVFDYIKRECNFRNTGTSPSEISIDTNILDKFPDDKEYIMNHFNTFKNNVLKYESVNFDMTTSWATKMTKNCYVQIHNHCNSFYSGILYLDDIDSNDGGKLQFTGLGLQSQPFKLNEPDEFTIWNSPMWYVEPKKNRLIFFPSYLYHEVKTYTGNMPRYSIAFNIFMKGAFGYGDSYLNIKE
jgi:uncharacterized protein (TIGR02466 family)